MAKRADARMLVDGQLLRLSKHKRDFTALGDAPDVEDGCGRFHVTVKEIGDGVCRLRCKSARSRNALMRRLRASGSVVHHVYVTELRDEIVLGGRLYLRMKPGREQQRDQIVTNFALEKVGDMGRTEVLAVTADTKANPMKAAARIVQRDAVEHCAPEFLWRLQSSQLTAWQWQLDANRAEPLDERPLLHPESDAAVVEAWGETRGDAEVVVAVIDDGFDLHHPALAGVPMKEGRDFQTMAGVPLRKKDPQQPRNAHGTMVASIALGAGGDIEGVAPACALLPIRLPIRGFTSPLKLQAALQFASDHAHVANMSIEFTPRTTDYFEQGFREFIGDLATTGGRDGRGLTIVVSAGNQDCPTQLTPSENKRGVRFRVGDLRKRIAKNRPVYTGLPNLDHPVVVAATTSTLRKAGYSNWGPDVTVAAPSGNGHELQQIDPDFDVPYPGRGLTAAVSRPKVTVGEHPPRLDDYPLYTAAFRGASGAAPIVSGIVALMRSVNRRLAPWEIKRILTSTADQTLDPTLDHANDPNIVDNAPHQGEFVDGHSWFFGAGKANAWRAVRRARLLADAEPRDYPREQQLIGPWVLTSGLGVAVQTPLGAGLTKRIDLSLELDGDGEVGAMLVSPQGYALDLGSVEVSGQTRCDFDSDKGGSLELQLFVEGRREGGGVWSLHLFRVDEGAADCMLDAWRIRLGPS